MPLERVSKGFKDISLSFKKNPLTDDIFPVKNETAIARSVRNIVYTQFGEKFFDYDFGTDVTASLFENIDTFSANILKDKIENSIINYEPRVKLIEVDVVQIMTMVNLMYQLHMRSLGLILIHKSSS